MGNTLINWIGSNAVDGMQLRMLHSPISLRFISGPLRRIVFTVGLLWQPLLCESETSQSVLIISSDALWRSVQCYLHRFICHSFVVHTFVVGDVSRTWKNPLAAARFHVYCFKYLTNNYSIVIANNKLLRIFTFFCERINEIHVSFSFLWFRPCFIYRR